jgi:hypothetical protein
MKIALGETRGNRTPTTPPSRKVGVNHPHTYRESYSIPCCFKMAKTPPGNRNRSLAVSPFSLLPRNFIPPSRV